MGNVSAIVPLAALQENEQININLLTTYIDEILVDVEDVNNELLDAAAETLQVGDSNNDEAINYQDVISYQMTEQGSIAETDARLEILDHIYAGEKEAIKKAVQKKESGLIF